MAEEPALPGVLSAAAGSSCAEALLSADCALLSHVPSLLLQARMMKALIQGLPKGFVYGCAQGTLVGVEAGFSHTVADMTCAQVRGNGLVSGREVI